MPAIAARSILPRPDGSIKLHAIGDDESDGFSVNYMDVEDEARWLRDELGG